jgi:hypothetical protein
MKKALIKGFTILTVWIALLAVLFLLSFPGKAFAQEKIDSPPPAAGISVDNHDPIMKLVEMTMIVAVIAGFAIRNRVSARKECSR